MTMHDEDELFAGATISPSVWTEEDFDVRLPAEVEQLQAENAALLAELARTSVELTEVKKST